MNRPRGKTLTDHLSRVSAIVQARAHLVTSQGPPSHPITSHQCSIPPPTRTHTSHHPTCKLDIRFHITDLRRTPIRTRHKLTFYLPFLLRNPCPLDAQCILHLRRTLMLLIPLVYLSISHLLPLRLLPPLPLPRLPLLLAPLPWTLRQQSKYHPNSWMPWVSSTSLCNVL